MSHFQITPEGVFTTASVSDVTIVDLTHTVYGPYHVYSLNVRAKIQPATASSDVIGPTASVTINTAVYSQSMQKETGNPADYYYKTISPISFGGPAAIAGPIKALVKATIRNTEDFEAESAPTTLP